MILLSFPLGGMHNIQEHTFGLACYTYMLLSSLCHGNRHPVAQIYTEGQFESPSTQGAIVNFNLVDSCGKIIGYSQVHLMNALISVSQYFYYRFLFFWWTNLFCHQVDRMARLYNIHVRTGCFCNTGACQYFIGITNERMKRNLQVRDK